MTSVQEWIAAGGIRKENYAFTVKHGGRAWDVYHFKKDGKPGTMAYRKQDDGWLVDIFCPGHLDEDAVVEKLKKELP